MANANVLRGGQTPRHKFGRLGLILAALALVLGVTIFVGARYGFMLAVGLGFGLALEGLHFGFAGPWRAMILRREPGGIWAQLLAIALVSVFALPLIGANPGIINGAQAPIGFSMIAGAFIFGIAMQVVLGCGSGTLVNAGSGNPVSLLALPFFAIGSFAGAYHVFWWTDLGSVYLPNLTGGTGIAITLIGLVILAGVMWFFATPEKRTLPKRLIFAAVALAGLAVLNLIISGQPWGVVYGLGLWVAKLVTSIGVDISGSAFWNAPATVERVSQSIFTDYTSLTNIGIMFGAFGVASWRSIAGWQNIPNLPLKAWLATIIAGFLLGYSSRLAFGCNVGAFFSGISTGSLHGWVWFAAAFGGAFIGIRLRKNLGFEVSS